MDDLFLERATEPLGDAVGLGLFDEGVGRLDAPELDLVGKVVRQIPGAVIHPQGQPASRTGGGPWRRAACGYAGQGSRLAHIPTGSTAATGCDKQDFGGMIRQRNTP